MKLLVTGAGGQLGLALGAIQRPALDIVGRSRGDLDITDPSATAKAIDDTRPDIVVNAAAYTNVDGAEADRDGAFRGNAEGPRWLALATAAAGIPLIHISTDFVFDGAASRPYRPDDPTAPLNVYGASKLAGERAVLDADPSALVIRTSWLYRLGSRNFVTAILRLLRETGRVSVVADQRGSPTSATSLAEATIAAALRQAGGGGLSGIRHFADGGETSRYDFALAIRDEGIAAGLVGVSTSVEPVTGGEAAVRRPAYSALDAGAICSELGFQQMSWREALARSFREDRGLLPF